MTNQEAIKVLNRLKYVYVGNELFQVEMEQAIYVAIKALESNLDTWIVDDTGYFHCPKCGIKPRDQVAMTDYCPNCGSDNRERSEE